MATAVVLPAMIMAGNAIVRKRAGLPFDRRHRVAAGYMAVHLVISNIAAPACTVIGNYLVTLSGGGAIALRASWPWVVPSFLAYLLARDFLEYAIHRAQHKFKILWRMHSLHHSDEAIDLLTSARHCWIETLIKASLLYPLLAIMFRIPPPFVFIASTVYLANHLWAHSPVLISIGRFTSWVMNPQYHRLHHSTDPKHIDRNFCDLFPLWDLMFGTAAIPEGREFPPTGLTPSDTPPSVAAAFLWPFRKPSAS